MMRWSCHRLHGCVPVDDSPTPSESVSPRSCTRRSPSFSAASANVSQRPVRTSTSEAISSPTMCGSRSVPCAASRTSSKRLTSSSVAGSSSANSSSTATVKSGTASNAAREVARSSSYPTFCSSPTTKRLVVERLQQALGHGGPAPLALDRPAGGGPERPPLGVRQGEELAQARAERVGVAGGERREMRQLGRILGADAGRDLGQAGVRSDHGREPGSRGLGRDHPERLGKDRRGDGDVAEREARNEVPVRERPGEDRSPRRDGLALGAVVAEADDDGPDVEASQRLEENLDPLVLDQLADVDHGWLVARERLLEARRISGIGMTLVAVLRVVLRLHEQTCEGLQPVLRNELLDVDAGRYLV